MVAGADLVNKCHLANWYPKENLGCVCVERPGYNLPTPLSPEVQLEKKFFVMRVCRDEEKGQTGQKPY
jgi:hypothetical protein